MPRPKGSKNLPKGENIVSENLENVEASPVRAMEVFERVKKQAEKTKAVPKDVRESEEETPYYKWLKKQAVMANDKKVDPKTKIEDEWFCISGQKVIQITKMKNGNVYRTFAGNVSKFREHIEVLKKEGKLRATLS